MTGPDLDALSVRTADELDAAGGFQQPWMRGLFLKVPRHAFVPDRVWVWSTDAYRPLDRTVDPVGWAQLVSDATRSVVTQVDDGRPGPDGGTLPTSSISAPNAVFTMLAAADLESGHRVAEIGTGTGYNAALLCERVGARNVVSVEIDPVVAESARRALRATGYRPTVVVADGEAGHPAGGPYDRLLSTASSHRVPGAWVRQVRPGGLIVTPWRTTLATSGMAVLRVTEDGRAQGHFGHPMAFMDLRGQRRDDCSPLRDVYTHDAWEDSRARPARSAPRWLDDDYHARFAVGLMLPGVHVDRQDADSGDEFAWWLSTRTSWAYVAGGTARQWGPRDLLDELDRAHDHWTGAGRPDLYRYGLTVTRDGTQRPWLDTPDALLPRPFSRGVTPARRSGRTRPL
ncbi:methyltransferase domain-containing protein [Streptomyces sp. NPDC057307]|uniref:methyltransferase domain-containing protein n=1 Tax=Streptomyces sp. NPDC057307 TaxID=3346096 RepID=UPI003643AF90